VNRIRVYPSVAEEDQDKSVAAFDEDPKRLFHSHRSIIELNLCKLKEHDFQNN